VSNTKDSFPKRAPIGVYDEGILCDECERKFGQVDSYAAEVLISKFGELFKPVANADNLALQAQGINQDLLLRFLVATLWRASVSTHPFYKRVQLGKHEAEAKTATDLSCPVPRTFAAVLSAWPALADDSLEYGLMDPFAEKWDGVNAYRVYLGRVVSYVKVDRRPLLSPLADLALGRQDSMFIVQRDFTTSKDLAAMARTAKESRKGVAMARARRK
jgi:hypothetical protein